MPTRCNKQNDYREQNELVIYLLNKYNVIEPLS